MTITATDAAESAHQQFTNAPTWEDIAERITALAANRSHPGRYEVDITKHQHSLGLPEGGYPAAVAFASRTGTGWRCHFVTRPEAGNYRDRNGCDQTITI